MGFFFFTCVRDAIFFNHNITYIAGCIVTIATYLFLASECALILCISACFSYFFCFYSQRTRHT